MRDLERKALRAWSHAGLLAVAATTAQAAEDPLPAQAATTTLPPVTVSTDWLGKPEAAQKKHPGARSVLTQEAIDTSGARTLDQALRQVPGVRIVDENGSGTLPNIGVRGLSPLRSEQVLLLQDGIPITLAPYGQTGASLFPLTLMGIETIDVARGGVAVHYGPNNVGGVINFLSRRIPRKPSWTLKESVSVARTGNVLTDTYVRGGGFVSDSLGLQVQANLIDGDGERDHAATSVRNLALDADWLVTDTIGLRGGLQHYETRNELPGALTPRAHEQDRSQSTRPLDRFDGDTTRAHLIYNQQFGNDTELTWTNFAHRSSRTFAFGNAANADAASTARQSSPRDYLVYGSEPKLSIAFGGAVPQTLSFGLRYVREEVDYLVDSLTLATGAYTVTRDWRFDNKAYAAYLSDTFALFDGALKVTPGVRREQVESNYVNRATGAQVANDSTDWLPGLDIGWQAATDWFFFANLHRSLRPVQFTQITFGGDLAAERAKNAELGVRWAATPTVDLSLALFRFKFDNKLEFVNATAGFRNLGKARHQGAEMELAWRPTALPGLALKTGLTLLDTEQLSGAFAGNDLPYAPRRQLNWDATWRTGDWSFGLNGQAQSRMYSDGANTPAETAGGVAGPIPGHALWNTQLGYGFRWGDTRMKAGLGVANLLDKDSYFRGVDYSAGRTPQPGRAVTLSLQADL